MFFESMLIRSLNTIAAKTKKVNKTIKKVFENLGYLVDKLTRVEYAFLNVDKLKSGEYRSLTIKEVKKLYEYKN